MTAVARVAFAGDCGGSGSSKAPKVAAAINAAFGRFATPTQTWLIIGGDEYTWCSTQTMKNYDRYLTQKNISAARTVMTPGNHTNGPGGSANTPDVRAWLAYNQAQGTLSNTTGGWIDQSHGIPLTDQYLDIGGIRFIIINSGGTINARPGWPIPLSGGSVAGNPRVAWLRSVWKPGTANVLVTHHPRYAYYGGPFDNPTMANLINEMLGANDGTAPHSPLILHGHTHNMQVMKPQFGGGSFPGIVTAVIGLCSTAPVTRTPPRGNTSQKSWLQFANLASGGCGFLQIDIMSDGSLQLSVVDGSDTSGKLMTNTPSTGVTGPATMTIATA